MSFLQGLFGPPDVGKLKTEGNVKGLIEALDYKKDPSVRQAAAEALEQIGAPGVEPLVHALRRATLVRNWRVSEAIVAVLDQLGWQPNESETGAAYWVTKRQWDKCVEMGMPAVTLLRAAIKDKDASVSQAATQALDEIGPPLNLTSRLGPAGRGPWCFWE